MSEKVPVTESDSVSSSKSFPSKNEFPIEGEYGLGGKDLGRSYHIGEDFKFPLSAQDKFTTEEEDVIRAHLNDRTADEAVAIIQKALVDHFGDPNVPLEKIEELQALVEGPGILSDFEWAHKVKFEAFLIHDWSIYPEVRAATAPFAEEEPHNPENLRVYVIGVLFSMSGSCLDTFFNNRFPGISISSTALQLFVVGAGHLWARIPVRDIPIGFGKRLTINPGPWSFKEQILCQMLMAVSVGSPYAYYALTAQKNENFFGFDGVSFGYVAMLVFSSQFLGFGVSGIMRSFLVYPQQSIFYSVLPTLTYARSISKVERRENTHGWKLLRYEAFIVFALANFAWYWVTNFLFTALSTFNWLAWIAPKNTRLQNITGSETGLGLNPLPTFDLNVMNQGGLVAPYWATSAALVGMFISLIAIVIVWFKNVRWTAYFPINSNTLYDNTGKPYKVANILNSEGKLDEEKYKKYSLPFYSAGNVVQYGVNFMVYTAMVVYALLNYSNQIFFGFKNFARNIRQPRGALKSFDDHFSRLQQKHKEVPEWWFLAVLAGAIAIAIAMVEHFKFSQTPVWCIFFAAALGIVFTIPFGILYSTTNYHTNINILYELIIGYAIPGNGNALMIGKVYATNFLDQADNYIANQKIGHYIGIAPRSLFRTQMISVIFNSWVQIGIIWWQLGGGVRDMCDTKNPQKFTCQGARTTFNAAIVWGTIGPKRVFDNLYPAMKWCFLIGALYPFPFWIGRRYLYPYIDKRSSGSKFYSVLRTIGRSISFATKNEVLLLGGGIQWTPYNLSYYLPNWYLATGFQWFLKTRYHAWWKKYSYVFYVGINVGIAYSALIMFFSTEYKHIAGIDWWGNNVSDNTGDASGMPLTKVANGTFFGPVPGTYN